MKNTIYSLFLLAVGGLLWYFVHWYSIPTDADIDLEIEWIQVEETIDWFVTQSELSSSEINENLQTRIDKLQSIRAKVAVNLNKQRRRIRNIDKKITRLQNSKIFSLYSCTDGEREIDETYTWCKALSWGGEFNDWDSVCDTTYPSASCTNNWNSTNTATRDHCGETYTDYDTYLAAYNASPSCT